MEELVNDAFGRIGENVDALMDDLIRNKDIHEGSQEFQGKDEGEERRYNVPWIAKQMTWHAQPKENGGVMRHPSDSSSWVMESVEGEPILKRLAVGPIS
ncbi:hypothetical protein MRB53_023790 [Persea americana]|uniref:Uncharacterized protein n=1 Tax=Persea americana TaxID=3435 RepID=A0ACC2LBJ1_PERAE|nr:hypothetical protein MRB53_023790 [Persea americana]